MDYNKLKTFVVVAQAGSVTNAATAMRRTQSAITQQIKILEGELGFSLFERKHGRIYLTAEGNRLKDFSEKTLGKIDDEILQMKNELTAVEGHLRIGVLDDFGTSQLSATIAAFKKTYPKIGLSIVFGTSQFIEEQLLANQVDVGILVTFKDKSFFKTLPLRTEDHLLCTSQAYLKAHSLKTFEQIVDADLIDFTEDFLCLGTWVRKNKSELMTRLMRRTPDVVLASHPGVKAIVLEGYGVAMLPSSLIEQELKTGSIVQIMKSSKPIQVGVDFAVRKKHTERLFEKLFREFLFKNQSS